MPSHCTSSKELTAHHHSRILWLHMLPFQQAPPALNKFGSGEAPPQMTLGNPKIKRTDFARPKSVSVTAPRELDPLMFHEGGTSSDANLLHTIYNEFNISYLQSLGICLPFLKDTGFLQKIAPLFELFGLLSVDWGSEHSLITFRSAASRDSNLFPVSSGAMENHSKRLYRYPPMDSHAVQQLTKLCPNIERLGIQIKRSMGSSRECDIYRAIGGFSRLHTLFLDLHCDPRQQPINIEAPVPYREVFANAATDEELFMESHFFSPIISETEEFPLDAIRTAIFSIAATFVIAYIGDSYVVTRSDPIYRNP
ncbi:hypothetical protein BJX70DRAFT_275998 [Aspergillus crustosus]